MDIREPIEFLLQLEVDIKYSKNYTSMTFCAENLYNTIKNSYNRNEPINRLGDKFLFILNFMTKELLQSEDEEMFSYINHLHTLCKQKATNYDELFMVVTDYIDSDEDTKYPSLLYKLEYILEDDNFGDIDLLTEYIDELAEKDIFMAKVGQALTLLAALYDDSAGPESPYVVVFNQLEELYQDERCSNDCKKSIAYELGANYYHGKYLEENIDKAYYFLNVASILDNKEAKLLLVDIYAKNEYLYNDEKIAFSYLLELYEDTKSKFLQFFNQFNIFRRVSYKMANFVENGIGCDKNKNIAYELYLESYAAYQSDMMNDYENEIQFDYDEYGDLINKLKELPLELGVTPGNSIDTFLETIDNALNINYLSLQIKEYKKSYKLVFSISLISHNTRMILTIPNEQYSSVVREFAVKINKADIQAISYGDKFIKCITSITVDDDENIILFDELDEECLSFKANKVKFDLK